MVRNHTKLVVIGTACIAILSGIILVLAFSDTEGPVILQIDVSPENPVVGDRLSITLYCSDQSGISGAVLSYSFDDDQWLSKDMEFLTCFCSSVGRWIGNVSIPEGVSQVQFYVTSIDASLNANEVISKVFAISIES